MKKRFAGPPYSSYPTADSNGLVTKVWRLLVAIAIVLLVGCAETFQAVGDAAQVWTRAGGTHATPASISREQSNLNLQRQSEQEKRDQQTRFEQIIASYPTRGYPTRLTMGKDYTYRPHTLHGDEPGSQWTMGHVINNCDFRIIVLLENAAEIMLEPKSSYETAMMPGNLMVCAYGAGNNSGQVSRSITSSNDAEMFTKAIRAIGRGSSQVPTHLDWLHLNTTTSDCKSHGLKKQGREGTDNGKRQIIYTGHGASAPQITFLNGKLESVNIPLTRDGLSEPAAGVIYDEIKPRLVAEFGSSRDPRNVYQMWTGADLSVGLYFTGSMSGFVCGVSIRVPSQTMTR